MFIVVITVCIFTLYIIMKVLKLRLPEFNKQNRNTNIEISEIRFSDYKITVYDNGQEFSSKYSTFFDEFCGIGDSFFVMSTKNDRYETYDFQCNKLGDIWRSNVSFYNVIGPRFKLKMDPPFTEIFTYDRNCKEIK